MVFGNPRNPKFDNSEGNSTVNPADPRSEGGNQPFSQAASGSLPERSPTIEQIVAERQRRQSSASSDSSPDNENTAWDRVSETKSEVTGEPNDAQASGVNFDFSKSNHSAPVDVAKTISDGTPISEVQSSAVRQSPPHADRSSLLPAYALFTTTVLLLAAWLIGPRIVEEYNFAATRGKVRAEYENAIELLEEKPLENVSRAFQLVAHKIRPSVVSIHAKRAAHLRIPGSQVSGYGSGVIMSREGFIITNAHVLEGAEQCTVQLHDRSRYEAKLIGVDLVSDLAVLSINARGLVPAVWGDSEAANVGSIVWAIGSPYRYEQTVTSGIISGKDRPGDKNRKQSLLQTDAAVNPGNSGGPLVNANGDVIGINTSIYGETFQGISFAVPSDTAKFVYQQLIANGSVVRGYLGVHPSEVDFQMAANGTLPDLDGAVLKEVVKNSPADIAGILKGDVIRQWNGRPVRQYNSLFQLAEMTPPNSVVDVVLIRDGKQITKQVVVGELPDISTQNFAPPVIYPRR